MNGYPFDGRALPSSRGADLKEDSFCNGDIDDAIIRTMQLGDKDAYAFLQSYKESRNRGSPTGTPNGKVAMDMIEALLYPNQQNGGETDARQNETGRNNGDPDGRSEVRTADVYARESGRDVDEEQERTVPGGLREGETGDGSKTSGSEGQIPEKERNQGVSNSVEQWSDEQHMEMPERIASAFNKLAGGKNTLKSSDITPTVNPNKEVVDALVKTQAFLGGSKTLLFDVYNGVNAP